jgi:hypothetical protein
MTKEDIQNILADLEADLKKGAVEARAAVLKKAAPGEPEDDTSAPAEGESELAPSEASDSASAGGPPPGPEGSSPEGGMPPPGADAGGPPPGAEGSSPAPGGDPAADGGGQLTPEALQAEYSQLAPEELDMHIQAALAAKEALQGAAGPGAPGAGAPPMPPPGPDAGGSAGPGGPPPPMMGKKEMKANGGQISTAKSEDRANKLEALVKSQQEDIENLSQVVKTILETPVRKSVTSLADVAPFAKTEIKTLSKNEVNDFIKANAAKMTKSERELWLSYVDNKVPAAKLAPMFERLSSNK